MTTPPNESNASRAKFEAAMRADGFESDHYFVQLSEEFRGDYYNDDTQMRWEGWQLAIASLSLAEPVAYRYRVKGQSWRTWFYAQEAPMPTNAHMFEIEPLYAHPPALADDAKFEELLNALCVEILEGVMETTCGKPIKARTALRAYWKQCKAPIAAPEGGEAGDLREDYRKARVESEQLAKYLWNKHYKNDAPSWGLCDSLTGIMTQIDNMVCGLVLAAPVPQIEPVASKSLTDDEIADLWGPGFHANLLHPELFDFARAIERAHGIGPSTSEGE